MAEFGYNNNAIRNQKHFKPITNGNVADSGMIHPKWTQTNLKSQTALKCRSVYMATYMEISPRQFSKQ